MPALLIGDQRDDLITGKRWDLGVFVAAEPNLGQQVLCLRLQEFGVTLCDKVLVYPM